VLARATGRRTRAVVSSLVSEIAQSALEHRLGKILIDVRGLEGWLGVMDSYFIVTEDFKRLRGKGLKKAAIVDRPRPEVREWFFEVVARNRGFYVRIFTDPAAAHDWLLGPKQEAAHG
jgi:hypothetical protein